jgi:hypothetical protein
MAPYVQEQCTVYGLPLHGGTLHLSFHIPSNHNTTGTSPLQTDIGCEEAVFLLNLPFCQRLLMEIVSLIAV